MTKSYIGYKAHDMGFDAHLTVIYLSKLSDADQGLVQHLLEDKIHDQWDNVQYVKRVGTDSFGHNKDISVVKVQPGRDMLEIRECLEFFLRKFNVSEYSWNPHITLDLTTINTIHIPRLIRLDSLDLY